MTIYELNNRLKHFDLTAEIKVALEKTKTQMADLNRQELLKGKNLLGQRIQPRYRSDKYAIEKNNLNGLPGFGVPDLFKTGDFHKSIEVKISAKTYELIATNWKSPILTDKYPLILGLRAKALEKYSRDTIMPILQQSLKAKISRNV